MGVVLFSLEKAKISRFFKLENFGKMDLDFGGGARPPKLAKIFKKLVEKSMENNKPLKLLMNF